MDVSALEKHIQRLATSKSYEGRVSYITDVLKENGISFHEQELPKKWQRVDGARQRNVVVDFPGWGDKVVYVAHHDAITNFDCLVSPREKGDPQLQHGANDNGSGVAVLLENIIDAKNKGVENRTCVFAAAEEGTDRGILYSLATGLNLAIGVTYVIKAGFMLVDFAATLCGVQSPLAYKFEAVELSKMGNLNAYLFPAVFIATLPFGFPSRKIFDRFRMGILGSKHYLDSLSGDEKARVKAALSVDMVAGGDYMLPDKVLGLNSLRFAVPYCADERLNDILRKAVIANNRNYTSIVAFGSSDHEPFVEENIPGAMLLANIPDGNLFTSIHTTKDRPDRINKKTLEDSAKILKDVQGELEGKTKITYVPSQPPSAAQIYQLNDKNYTILTYREGKNLVHVLAEVERENNSFNVKNIIDWCCDGNKERLFNSSKARKIKLEDFEIMDDEEIYHFKSPSFSTSFAGRIKNLYGRVQEKLASYFLLTAFGLNTSYAYSAQVITDVLSRGQYTGYAVGGSILIGMAAVISAILKMDEFVDSAQKNITDGEIKSLASKVAQTD